LIATREGSGRDSLPLDLNNFIADSAEVLPGANLVNGIRAAAERSSFQTPCQRHANGKPKPNATNVTLIMLRKAKTLTGYKLDSLDGELGTVQEFYFDDRHWTIRYLVADTGNWFTGRRVLLSPYALVAVASEKQLITVNLTKRQIQDSPSLNTDKPVSQQFEEEYHGYYGWPTYWHGPHMWGSFSHLERDCTQWRKATQGEKAWDYHLRSTHAVSGYHIQAEDGELGHVDDFIIDDATWAIRYLVIETRNWWPGKRVLVSPLWIERVSWDQSKVVVNLRRETIKRSPEYTEESLLTRDYEAGLHRHYNRQGYWVDEAVGKMRVKQ
jgi:uncharacterized protein YrrD